MKYLFLFLILLFTFNKSIAQIDCIQNDGNYSYIAKLNINNLPSDFNKSDFINHIINTDNISSQDINTLNSSITIVKKVFPSLITHRSISIKSSSDLVSILSMLNNSINSYNCYLTDCEQSDGSFSYYVLLTSETVADGYDKNDFINFISANDNISASDISTLNQEVISVTTPFGFSNNPVLQRILAVDSNTELFSLFDSFINSIEFHECRNLCSGDECLLDGTLSINDIEKNINAIVYPNPITDKSALYLTKSFKEIEIQIVDNLGKVVHEEIIRNKTVIKLKHYKMVKGTYFLIIHILDNDTKETIKLVKV